MRQNEDVELSKAREHALPGIILGLSRNVLLPLVV